MFLGQRRLGLQVRPEVMVPLVGTVQELRTVRDEIEAALAAEAPDLDVPIGTMIELPRAALTASQIAEHADFFSFGTNDLTQTTWGFSRDDVEGSFFPTYLERGIFEVSPFESIDPDGVGRLVRIAVAEGRKSLPVIKLGVCGEHGAIPHRCSCSTTAGSITCPARCSGFRSRGWKPAGRRSRTGTLTTTGFRLNGRRKTAWPGSGSSSLIHSVRASRSASRRMNFDGSLNSPPSARSAIP